MRQVNTKDGRTLLVAAGQVCTADYDPRDGTAILSMSSGEVIRTDEYAPEILEDLGLISTSQAEALDKELTEAGVLGTKPGQK